MRKWILWTALGTLVVAVVVHVVTLVAIPLVIMSAAMAKFPVNELSMAPKTTAGNRLVVRPCPDLVYSVAPYDVSKGSVLFTAQVPVDTYWSVSLYNQDTDNFFVINDRQIKSNPYSLLLVKQGMKYENPANAQVVVTPGDRGLLLVRHLLVSDDKINELVEIQKQASVKVISAQTQASTSSN
jgi:uncharacterized membrane protein